MSTSQRSTPIDEALPLSIIAGMRPKQWTKNVLVLAVPLAAGRLFEPQVLLQSTLAFIAFCAASGATYLVNDCVDRHVDRAHPTKRFRPVASGRLTTRAALVSALVLLAFAVGLGFFVRIDLGWTVVAYIVATLVYSLWLKNEPVIELALLALGFLLRSLAGGAATGIAFSNWFLLVAGFGSLFMAAGKRFSELTRLQAPRTDEDEEPERVRRSLAGYTLSYLRFVWGVSAAVTITAYCLWAFEVAGARSVLGSSGIPWVQISVLPFVLAILRYAVVVDGGRAEAPEDAVLNDRVLLVLGLMWVTAFGLGAAA